MCDCNAETGTVCTIHADQISRTLTRIRRRRGTFGPGYENGLQALRELYGPARVNMILEREAAEKETA